MTATPLHIVELRAENVKRLRAVHIKPNPDGSMVVLSGSNGAGKSSVLDAISMALGGRDQIPHEPIRRGEDRAEVVVDLGEIVVRRTFTPTGGGALTVSNRDGAKFSSPQTMLDALVGRLTFDPLEFSREKPSRQAEILRDLVGLDVSDIDAERERVYAERTDSNRQVKAMQARLDAMPHHPDAPKDPVNVSELADELAEAEDRNRQHASLRDLHQTHERDLLDVKKVVAELRRRLAEAEADLVEAEKIAADYRTRVAGLQDIETAPIRQQLRDAESINRKVRENHERANLAIERVMASGASDRLSERIAALDEQRAARIASAPMPVDGLGFNEDGRVTLNGIALEQASAGERLRVSVAIGLAMNPRLRVLLIRDASLLDSESMRIVADMASRAGSQLWVERVESSDATTIVIEDGQVAQATEAAT